MEYKRKNSSIQEWILCLQKLADDYCLGTSLINETPMDFIGFQKRRGEVLLSLINKGKF